MPKLKYISLVAILLLPLSASALAVQWDRPAVGRINPLYILDTVFGNIFTATSTTLHSTFPYASTTALSATTLCLSTDCRTLWPTGTITSVGATYPVQSSGGTTPVISLAFGTTTSNTWAGTQTFTNAPVFSSLTSGTLNVDSSGIVYKTGTSTPTVTAPITYSGTLGQFIGGVSGTFGCTTASAGVTGCLSGTDWSTFNSKQPAIALGAGTVNSSASNALYPTATTSVSSGTGISFTGTAGALIGGTNLTITNSGVISNSCSSGITCSGTNPASFSIASNALTLSMFPQIAANTVIGNLTGSTATPTAFATSSLGIALSDTTGTLAINRGGTNNTAYNAHMLIAYDGTKFVATSSPTVGFILATSTTATSIFSGNVELDGNVNGWVSYTPVVTAQSGSITSYTATGSYLKLGKTLFVQTDVTITNIGTGALGLRVSVPFTANAKNFDGSSREFAVIGKAGSALVLASTNVMDERAADNTTYIVNNAEIGSTVFYEIP